MKALIKDKKEVAQGTLQVTFDLLGQKLNFQPGQYFFLTLPKLLYPDDRGNMRHFSIVNPPSQDGLTMATRITESGFKKTLKDLPLGSEVQIGSPEGDFTLPKDQARSAVLIAGGIGITPFMSMLSYVQENGLPYQITLLYSNRNKQSTAYLEKLEQMAKENPHFKLVLTMTEDPAWKDEKRRIDSQFIKDTFDDLNGETYFVAGPPGMVGAIRKALEEAGVEEMNIKTENFSGY